MLGPLLIGLAAVVVVIVAVWVVLDRRTSPSAKSQQSTAVASTSASSEPASASTPAPSAGPTTPAVVASPPGLASARAVNALIAQSVAARRLITVPIRHITECVVTQTDIDQLGSAARIRRSLVVQLQTLNVQSVSGGAVVVSRLEKAWTYSSQADDAYATWGQDNVGCFDKPITTGDAAYAQFNYYNKLSTHMKQLVTPQWNAIAARYGLPYRGYKQI